MSALAAAAQHHLAVWAGWTALVVLWESLVVALAFAAWRTVRPSASAESLHSAGLAALALCVAGLVATPVLLASWPATHSGATPPVAGVLTPQAQAQPVTGRVVATPFAVPAATFNTAAGVAGLLWLGGASLLFARLAGGWWMAGRLRRRAVVVDDPDVLDTVRRVSDGVRVDTPLALLESSEIEAPIVVGARRPAIIVPNDLRAQLGATALAPLVAHECAHVRRADYAANLAQSAVEAALFFSPAVHWISRVVRETREYCCDDAAVRWCGEDKSGYVRALTGLAALGSRNRTQPVLGAAGPRLITRVRRLLSEDTMQRSSFIRLLAVIAALAAVVFVGRPVLAFSAARAQLSAAGATESSSKWPLPIGWVMRQPGSAVILERVESDAAYLAASVTLRNEANVAVTGVGLVGIAEIGQPWSKVSAGATAVDVAIPPGAAVTVAARFIDRAQLAQMAKEAPARQVSFGLVSVHYANGSEWSVQVNPAARTMDEALSLPPAQVDRSLIGDASSGSKWLCYDQQKREYSPGAVVVVANEPGRMAVCGNGVWLDYLEAGASQPAPPSPAPGEKAPIPIKQVRPKYTKALMDTGTQGTVTVEITVTTEGKVSDAVVKKSLAPAHDAEALRVARLWEFTPGTKDGVPVAVRTELEFTFTVR
jgi:TonB family protein